ncbi:ROK family glucokinase [soil metagenome]
MSVDGTVRSRPGMLERLAVGIDIGGTKVAAGVVDESGHVLERLRRDTPTTSPSAVEDIIAEIVTELRRRHRIYSVGVGAAGFVDATRSSVLFAPHLAWRHEPLRDALRRRTGLSVVVENDANAAAWAEWRFGAARNEEDLVCITLGTGIGGALLFNGAVHRGRFGIAGEFGHMQVVPAGHRCECGNRGCWEQYASGNALVREARELARANSPVIHHLLSSAGGDPGAITGPSVTAAAQAGDPAAVELLAEVGQWLGVGIASLAAAFDPGMFVIGGGVSDAGDLLIAPARDSYRRTLTGRGFRPEARILRAQLGNEAGMIGAADRVRVERRRRRRGRGSRSRARATRPVLGGVTDRRA